MEITRDLIIRFIENKTTPAECDALADWIETSEDNKKTFDRELQIHLAVINLLGADEDMAAAGKKSRRRIPRLVSYAAGIAAAVAVFFFSQHITGSRYEERIAGTMGTIVVPAGKSMDYILPDGSTVRLNSGARLTYPVLFAKDSREVSLEGEAYFEIMHDTSRPFTVKTFASDIKVLGTKFNVNADEARGLFSTTLVEGSVLLTDRTDGKEIIMKPSQTVSLVSGKLTFDNTAAPEIQWINGILSVSTRDFTELMEKLETAFGVDIIIERDTMPEFDCIRGKFRISDGIDHALQVLQDMMDFKYTKDYATGNIYIR